MSAAEGSGYAAPNGAAPREAAGAEAAGIDLNDDTPLTPVCDLSGEGTCEACQ